VSEAPDRRRLVAMATVAGAALLGMSLVSEPDSPRFYGLTTGVAATWLVAGAAAGPAPAPARRQVVGPIAVGIAAFAVFYLAALVARRIPVLGRAIAGVLTYAHHGRTPLVLATTLLNAVAEEVFFRGTVYDVLDGRHPVATSTAVYVSVTGVTRNPALVLASLVMGTLFAWQRRSSGDVWAPILTHVTWSTLMLSVLPRLFSASPAPARRG
jgi:CAAX protease family protein